MIEKKPGDLIKLRAKGEIKDVNEEGRVEIILHDIHDTTKAEVVRLAGKDGVLDDDELAFVFGGDE